MVGALLSISRSCSFANKVTGSGARSDIGPFVQGNVPNIVGRSNPFTRAEDDEWVNPQVLLDIADSKDYSKVAIADGPMGKPQRPHKPVALSQPVSKATDNIEAQLDGGGINGDGAGEPKPRLPPRPPTWQTDEHVSPQPIKWSATAGHTSTNLLDEMDPAMDKWKPLLPHR